MSLYMLDFDYPHEDERCVGVDTAEQIATELLHDYADGEAQAKEIAAVLLRDGVWRDEGGKIVLYKRVGTDGVTATEQRSADSLGKLIEALEFVIRHSDSLTPSDIQRMQAILAEVGDKQ